VLADAFTATYEGPANNEPPQVAAWHSAIYDAALPLLAAAQDAGAIRSDLSLMELMALTAAVARAGDPAHSERFLDLLLEGIVPRPAAEHAADPHTPQDEEVSLSKPRLTQAAGAPLTARGVGFASACARCGWPGVSRRGPASRTAPLPVVVSVRVLPGRGTHPAAWPLVRSAPKGDMPDYRKNGHVPVRGGVGHGVSEAPEPPKTRASGPFGRL
jgi:hypothetical protein